MSANVTWQVPFGAERAVKLSGVTNAILGNWDFSVIQRFGSGVPLTVSVGGGVFPANTGNGVDLKPEADANSVNPQDPVNYINPDPFMLPTLDGTTFNNRVIGNLGNGTTIGPGLISTDLSLAKNLPLQAVSDQFSIQFRIEAFNLFNRANFGRPNSNVFQNTGTTAQAAADPARFIRVDPSFGRITRTSTTARQLQFGLRIQF